MSKQTLRNEMSIKEFKEMLKGNMGITSVEIYIDEKKLKDNQKIILESERVVDVIKDLTDLSNLKGEIDEAVSKLKDLTTEPKVDKTQPNIDVAYT